MWTAQFWKATGAQMLGAFAVVLLAKLGGGDLAGVDVLAVDWKTALSWATGAGLCMGLFSIVAAMLPAGGKGNPTLVWPPNPPVVRRDDSR